MTPKPSPFNTYDVRYRFKHLECLSTGEDGPAEPYVWIFFYKIDGQGFRVSDNGSFLEGAPIVITHEGNAIADATGNESYSPMFAGQVAAIPERIGEWTTRVYPISAPEGFNDLVTGGPLLLPGLFGFVVAVLEQDTSSRRARSEAHKAINAMMPELIRTYISGTPLPLLAAGIPNEQMKAWEEQVTHELGRIYLDDMDAWEYVDFDDTLKLLHVLYEPGPTRPNGKIPSLSGHVRNDRFWPIGIVMLDDDTEEKRTERTKNGEWYLGVEYDVDIANNFTSFGEAVGVRVYDGDAGELLNLLLDTTGRTGTRSTVITPNGPRDFVTYRFDADELDVLNNAIGTIDVPGGYKVVVYESPGFSGRSKVMDRYGATGVRYHMAHYAMPARLDRIPRIGTAVETWNNRVSSIEVTIENIDGFIH